MYAFGKISEMFEPSNQSYSIINYRIYLSLKRSACDHNVKRSLFSLISYDMKKISEGGARNYNAIQGTSVN